MYLGKHNTNVSKYSESMQQIQMYHSFELYCLKLVQKQSIWNLSSCLSVRRRQIGAETRDTHHVLAESNHADSFKLTVHSQKNRALTCTLFPHKEKRGAFDTFVSIHLTVGHFRDTVK